MYCRLIYMDNTNNVINTASISSPNTTLIQPNTTSIQPNTTSTETKNNMVMYISIGVLVVLLVVGCILLYVFVIKKKDKTTDPSGGTPSDKPGGNTPGGNTPDTPGGNTPPINPPPKPDPTNPATIYSNSQVLGTLYPDYKKTYNSGSEKSGGSGNLWVDYTVNNKNFTLITPTTFDSYTPKYTNSIDSNVINVNGLYKWDGINLNFDSLSGLSIDDKMVITTDNLTNPPGKACLLDYLELANTTDARYTDAQSLNISPVYNNCRWSINDSSIIDHYNNIPINFLDLSTYNTTDSLQYLFNNITFKTRFVNLLRQYNPFEQTNNPSDYVNKYDTYFKNLVSDPNDSFNPAKIYNSFLITNCDTQNGEYLIKSDIKEFSGDVIGAGGNIISGKILVNNKLCCGVSNTNYQGFLNTMVSLFK